MSATGASSLRDSELNQLLDEHHDTTRFTDSLSHASAKPASSMKQCGNNCTRIADCKDTANGCTCRTQSEQYVPGKGTVMYAAACIVSLGGKREEQRPCPCNQTYVSDACCAATDGIVQEPTYLKLGELLPAVES